MNSTEHAKEIPYVNVKIQENKLRMTVNTGATINVPDRRTFDQMTNINLQPTNVKSYAYNTITLVKFFGKFEAVIETKRRYAVTRFYVVQNAKSTGCCFLSSNTTQELGLVTSNLIKLPNKSRKHKRLKIRMPEIVANIHLLLLVWEN